MGREKDARMAVCDRMLRWVRLNGKPQIEEVALRRLVLPRQIQAGDDDDGQDEEGHSGALDEQGE